MRKLRISLFKNEQGVSPSISAVIMTTTIIVLVIVASSYAYQLLEQQRGVAEFEVAKKSILTFNDALENTAWRLQASRSARFTVNYGQLELFPEESISVIVNASVGNYHNYTEVSTGFIRYSIKTKYVNLGENYSAYLLGDEKAVFNSSTESYGRALLEQLSGWVNITLTYRVQAMRTLKVQSGNETVNYVDVLIIKLKINNYTTYIGDFDLRAKCVNITTITHGPYAVAQGDNGTVSVKFGSESDTDSIFISLDPGTVIFNFIIAEIQVDV